MRIQMLFVFLLISQCALPQGVRMDFAKLEDAATQRNAITTACQVHLKNALGFQPRLTIDHLYMKDDFAFLVGKVQDNSGNEIDFARFDFSKQKTIFPFKGQETRALLKRKGDGWEVLSWIVSPDAAYCACWWADYNAPKELFDFTDYCR